MTETTEQKATADPAGRANNDLLADCPHSIGDAVEKAAKHLPNGYIVNIQVEHNGYNVMLEHPDGSETASIDGGDGIRSDINEAICIANGFVS